VGIAHLGVLFIGFNYRKKTVVAEAFDLTTRPGPGVHFYRTRIVLNLHNRIRAGLSIMLGGPLRSSWFLGIGHRAESLAHCVFWEQLRSSLLRYFVQQNGAKR